MIIFYLIRCHVDVLGRLDARSRPTEPRLNCRERAELDVLVVDRAGSRRRFKYPLYGDRYEYMNISADSPILLTNTAIISEILGRGIIDDRELR